MNRRVVSPPLLRICGVISSLGPGGAERVMATLAGEWARRGHAVTVVTLAGTAEDFYSPPEGVARIGLEMRGLSLSRRAVVRTNLRRARALRAAIGSTRPDVVIAFGDTTNVLTVAAATGLGVPVLVAERVHPLSHLIGRGRSLLRGLAYRRADRVIVQAEETALWARRITSPSRVEVIRNPLAPVFTIAHATDQSRRPVILGMGRLTRQKGFDLLLRAFASVTGRHPDWTLLVLGAGPLDGELRNLAKRLLPADSVHFPGLVHEPQRYLWESSIFVLPSRYEGFPNALLEAMACGCAVIAADCLTGPRQIVQDGVDGLLVPPEDPAALSRALERLVCDPVERRRLGSRATRVREPYSAAAIAQRWERLMRAVIRERARP